MNDFSSNLNNKNSEPIISFDTLNSIYNYLLQESSSFEFAMGIYDRVFVTLYTIPDSFDHEKGQEEVKGAGFNDSYEVLNEIYKKIDIEILSEEVIQEGSEYDFINISFYSEPFPKTDNDPNLVVSNYLIFFCCTNGMENDDFEILFSNTHFFNYTKGLLNSEPLNINNPKNDEEFFAVKKLKRILQGIFQFLKGKILENVEFESSGNLLADFKNEKKMKKLFEDHYKINMEDYNVKPKGE